MYYYTFDETENASNIYNKIVIKGERPSMKETVSQSFQKLIESCWSQNPDERPDFDEIVELLLQNKKVDINIADKEGKTPFCVACENGFHKIVKRILQRPEADLNTIAKSGSAFGLAVENWHYKVVQILIESEKIIYQHEYFLLKI